VTASSDPWRSPRASPTRIHERTFSFRTTTREDFSTAVGAQGWDMCSGMEVNRIYEYQSTHDEYRSAKHPSIGSWHS
jgi:hypothetical protein